MRVSYSVRAPIPRGARRSLLVPLPHCETMLEPKRSPENVTECSAGDYTTMASEEALGHLWNDPAEDEAWQHIGTPTDAPDGLIS